MSHAPKPYVVVVYDNYIPEANLDYYDTLEEAESALCNRIAEAGFNPNQPAFVAEVITSAAIQLTSTRGGRKNAETD